MKNWAMEWENVFVAIAFAEAGHLETAEEMIKDDMNREVMMDHKKKYCILEDPVKRSKR